MLKIQRRAHSTQGQAIIEFAFCMVIVFLMAYGMIMIFKWTAQDLINRGNAHESNLRGIIPTNYHGYTASPSASFQFNPVRQVTPSFYYPTNMRAVVGE